MGKQEWKLLFISLADYCEHQTDINHLKTELNIYVRTKLQTLKKKRKESWSFGKEMKRKIY